jgi:epoxyqueuosine reductase QueG
MTPRPRSVPRLVVKRIGRDRFVRNVLIAIGN